MTVTRRLLGPLVSAVVLFVATGAPTHAHQPHLVPQLPSHTRQAVSDFVWFDRSASYNPSPALTMAKLEVAQSVAALPQITGSPATTIYVGTISNDSYAPSEVRLVLHIPAVPARPAVPSPNPISQSDTLKQLAAYAHRMQTYRRMLGAAHAAALTATQRVRALALPSEGSSTDIWGALQRTSDVHPTHLIMATDLASNGQQQVALHHSLHGVSVRIIEFQCGQASGNQNEARVCEQRKASWTKALARSGATDIQYFFPGQPVGNLFGS
jgi:hypothetical protein